MSTTEGTAAGTATDAGDDVAFEALLDAVLATEQGRRFVEEHARRIRAETLRELAGPLDRLARLADRLEAAAPASSGEARATGVASLLAAGAVPQARATAAARGETPPLASVSARLTPALRVGATVLGGLADRSSLPPAGQPEKLSSTDAVVGAFAMIDDDPIAPHVEPAPPAAAEDQPGNEGRSLRSAVADEGLDEIEKAVERLNRIMAASGDRPAGRAA